MGIIPINGGATDRLSNEYPIIRSRKTKRGSKTGNRLGHGFLGAGVFCGILSEKGMVYLAKTVLMPVFRELCELPGFPHKIEDPANEVDNDQ